MTLIRNKPFERQHIDSKKTTISLKWNDEYRELLDQCKQVLEQEKDGTAIKQVFQIGAKELLDRKMASIMGMVFANKRRNKRLGIVEFK